MRTLIRGLAVLALAGWIQLPAVVRADNPAVVTIEVSILELAEKPEPSSVDAETAEKWIARLKELEAAGKLGGITRLKLSTVENCPASAQSGERAPVVSGRQFVGRGGPAGQDQGQPIYTVQNYGTMVSATPRVEEGGSILLELSIEKSGPAREASAKADQPVPAADLARMRVLNINLKSTVRIPNGKTIIVGASGNTDDKAPLQTVILVSARADKAPAAEPKNVTQLQVYYLKFVQAEGAVEVLQKLFDNSLKLIADERTNSLIVSATPKQAETIEAVLKMLDAPKEAAPTR